MNIKVEMELPFEYCGHCLALSPKKDEFCRELIPNYNMITCENEGICLLVDKARRKEEEHGHE